jgi:hypothetical protein
MHYRSWSNHAAGRLLVGTTAALWLACGGGGELTAPTTGAVQVTTSTAGDAPDPDGYGLTLDDVEVQSIGSAATATLDDLTAGAHRIGLAGVSSNCTVQGDNPRALTVVAGETAAVDIAVVCLESPPATGGVSVTTSTTGPSPDPDGYSVTVDGDGGRPVGVDGTVVVSDLSPGDHLVALAGVAGNCTVAGENPRTVVVVGGDVAALEFSVECGALPPVTGTVAVTTVTSGAGADPDGYAFAIGDGAAQPIGQSATVSVANVAAGAITVELSGVAANCAVDGLNPRPVTVPADGSVEVTFAITCSAVTGTLEVTTASTGSPPDPSGYTVSVDGGAAVAIGANATRTIGGLAPGAHSVALGGIAGNCAVQGQNPRGVTITADQTAFLTFTVQCAATTGSLAVTIAGLPSGADADVTVTGPGDYSERLTATGTLDGLVPGQYTVGAASVTSGGVSYTSSPENRTVAVAAGATATVTVTYAASSGPSLNLWIAGLYLTQSVQTFTGEVPLIAGRDAFLRVFVRASETNTATPEVRVRLYEGDALIETLTIPAPAGSVPLRREEGTLTASWNVAVPGSFIRPGLGFRAEVDPANAIAEEKETDNAFPATGERGLLSVRRAPPLSITLVPVRQGANQLQGEVTAGNRDQYLDLTQRIYPLPGYQADVHAVYATTTTNPLQPDDANGAWITVLNEIAALWVAEGSNRHYYGVVRTGYTSGLVVGRGFIGLPVAIGYDEPAGRGRITAHELGHTWGRDHSPCGTATGLDPQFPYVGGSIGRFGFDVRERVLKQPETPDIMGYCGDPWISDYTYRGVLDFRGTPLARASGGREQPSLLVWGRMVKGRAVLEPAFQIVTRPVLPSRPGPYSIEGTASDGSRVFSLSFDAIEVADDAGGARLFAYAVPLDERLAGRLETIRLAGPGVGVAARSASPAALRATPAEPVSALRSAGGVAVRWDAAAHPMIMVRDVRTGEVLSFARGGSVVVPADGSEVELVMSDGVRSRSTTVRPTR